MNHAARKHDDLRVQDVSERAQAGTQRKAGVMDDLGRLCVARTAQVVHIATDRRTAGGDATKALIVHTTNGSARSNRLQMAGTPAAVYELLNEVWTPALDRAKEEMAEMNTMLQRDVPGATFEPWDWRYYAEKVRKDKYALDDATLRPYFSLENVREGAFSLANRLYGITFRPLVAPVYHKDCSVYEVLDVDGTHLGVLYFDFFPRSGKSSGAWCTAFRSQRYEGDERIAPVVAIVCNFTPPTKLPPSLLTLDEVQTLFHEFGHGLHALFADVKYRALGRVEGDFVELPSQIMENWATEPEVLRHYAINYTTGEVIPERLI